MAVTMISPNFTYCSSYP